MKNAKPTLPTLFDAAELQQPGKQATAIRSAGASASGQKTVMVDFDKLYIVPGFNPRVKDTQAAREHIESIGQSILANGYYADKPMAVFVRKIDGKDRICVRDGHNRYAGVEWANARKKGHVKKVPVVFDAEEMSMKDMTIRFHTGNNGRPLTPYELGVVVSRLLTEKMSTKAIAEHLGITERYIRDLGMLMHAPAELVAMIENGRVSSTTAIEQLRTQIQELGAEKGPAKALRIFEKAIEKEDARGSKGAKRISSKHLPESGKPKKFRKEPETSTATAPDRSHKQAGPVVEGADSIRFDAALIALEILEKHRNNRNVVSVEEADAIDDAMKQIVKKFGQEALPTFAVDHERYEKTGLVRLGFVEISDGSDEGDDGDEPTPPKKGNGKTPPKKSEPAKKQPSKAPEKPAAKKGASKAPAKKAATDKPAAKKGATKPASKAPAKKATKPASKKPASKRAPSKPEPVQQDLLEHDESVLAQQHAAEPVVEEPAADLAPVDLVAAEQARINQEAASL